MCSVLETLLENEFDWLVGKKVVVYLKYLDYSSTIKTTYKTTKEIYTKIWNKEKILNIENWCKLFCSKDDYNYIGGGIMVDWSICVYSRNKSVFVGRNVFDVRLKKDNFFQQSSEKNYDDTLLGLSKLKTKDSDTAIIDIMTNIEYKDFLKLVRKRYGNFYAFLIKKNFSTYLLVWMYCLLELCSDKNFAFGLLKNNSNVKQSLIFNEAVAYIKKNKLLRSVDLTELSLFFVEVVIELSTALMRGNEAKMNKRYLLNKFSEISSTYSKTLFEFKEQISICLLDFFIFKGYIDFIQVGLDHIILRGELCGQLLKLSQYCAWSMLPGFETKKSFFIGGSSCVIMTDNKISDAVNELDNQVYQMNFKLSNYMGNFISFLSSKFSKILEISKKFFYKDSLDNDLWASNNDLINKFIKEEPGYFVLVDCFLIASASKFLSIKKFKLNRRIDFRGRVYSSGALSTERSKLVRSLLLIPESDCEVVSDQDQKDLLLAKILKLASAHGDIDLDSCYSTVMELLLKPDSFDVNNFFLKLNRDDDPWGSLSYFLDYLSVYETGVSQKIYFQDATNSAYQNIAGLLRDRKLASLCNVVFVNDENSDWKEKRDVYTSVAKIVQASGYKSVTRKEVKKIVMTIPYGLSSFGAIEYIRAATNFEHGDSVMISKLIADFCKKNFPCLDYLILFLQSYILFSVYIGKKDFWLNIGSLNINFFVYKKIRHRFLLNETAFSYYKYTSTPDKRSSCTSVTANFTHAHDARLLFKTLELSNANYTKNNVNITVHDCFGTPISYFEKIVENVTNAYNFIYFDKDWLIEKIYKKLISKKSYVLKLERVFFIFKIFFFNVDSVGTVIYKNYLFKSLYKISSGHSVKVTSFFGNKLNKTYTHNVKKNFINYAHAYLSYMRGRFVYEIISENSNRNKIWNYKKLIMHELNSKTASYCIGVFLKKVKEINFDIVNVALCKQSSANYGEVALKKYNVDIRSISYNMFKILDDSGNFLKKNLNRISVLKSSSYFIV